MNKKFYIETYGCQMNVADSEVVARIMTNYNYQQTTNYQQADIILINTCAIRQSAENRIYGRLGLFTNLKTKKKSLKVGLLGCMAQRIKAPLLEKTKTLDFVAGPDNYQNLPEIIKKISSGERIISTKPSKTETYDNIKPLHYSKNKISGFTSISRGCNNMCSFCIVPFTRGRERSRNPQNIISEIKDLQNQGFKEVTLLGQNVDKYNFETTSYKFSDLLELVASTFPNLRIRFATSYPKDMTDEVLKTIAKYKNICKYIHLPVQSGSTTMLKRMKRGYTREFYLNRIAAIKQFIPQCAISTDIIAGFSNETNQEHLQTISLMEKVKFDYAYMFKYSERPNTYASKKLPDNIPDQIKSERLSQIIELQNKLSYLSNKQDINKTFKVLVEGTSKRNETQLFGRNSQNKTIIFTGHKSLIGKYINITVQNFTQATLLGKIANSCPVPEPN